MENREQLKELSMSPENPKHPAATNFYSRTIYCCDRESHTKKWDPASAYPKDPKET